jgi:hypothetical protein
MRHWNLRELWQSLLDAALPERRTTEREARRTAEQLQEDLRELAAAWRWPAPPRLTVLHEDDGWNVWFDGRCANGWMLRDHKLLMDAAVRRVQSRGWTVTYRASLSVQLHRGDAVCDVMIPLLTQTGASQNPYLRFRLRNGAQCSSCVETG